MATPTADQARDQALDVIAQVQEAGLKLAGSVAESWATVLRGVPGMSGVLGADAHQGDLAARLPQTAGEAVDRFYDTGVQVLEAQRAAAHQVLDAVAPQLRAITVVTPPSARG
ncbi:hypothetical protein Acsp06_26740 [Actinomycetospora sp. NBRC 106375]|uniref:hypothetical protein n=1 Tax=Actinomycetospora sp. NBRC 106375 TaxID=3032207 RepID=UPI0024A5C3E1|nr:hypothetical protein [Actinomycetospora sp. NBRC 106375]GLZ46489.1 hypothetical protein Acsp06_26740 [Actinomycetospora sp. NBRC 106375]